MHAKLCLLAPPPPPPPCSACSPSLSGSRLVTAELIFISFFALFFFCHRLLLTKVRFRGPPVSTPYPLSCPRCAWAHAVTGVALRKPPSGGRPRKRRWIAIPAAYKHGHARTGADVFVSAQPGPTAGGPDKHFNISSFPPFNKNTRGEKGGEGGRTELIGGVESDLNYFGKKRWRAEGRGE